MLQRTLNACRWVYNQVLETRKEAWEQRQESLSRYETVKMLPGWKAEHPFLKDAYSQVLQEVCTRVDLAFHAFFRRVKAGEEPGYPRFKGKYRYDSFTCPQSGFQLLENGHLRLSKIGEVKIKVHRAPEGACKTLTIRRDRLGNWYACFSCIVEPRPLPPTDKVVGVDLGLTTFAMLSNGQKIARQRWMKRDTKDIARLQRKKEKFPKGSSGRRKVVRALQHAYQRAANRRCDFAHFVRFTTYKAEEAGRSVALVDPRGTTQQCADCGQVVPKDLSVRKHECPYCGLSLDRDHNAAINILSRGLATLGASNSRPESSPF